jgi:hypothetical protein
MRVAVLRGKTYGLLGETRGSQSTNNNLGLKGEVVVLNKILHSGY